MFNGIKGIESLVAASHGFNSVDEMRRAEERSAKMRELGIKGGQARRAKEDPVMLAVKARNAGCKTAAEVAGWIARYVKGGGDVANRGPRPTPPANRVRR